ncbi:hypothetical protein HS088_TW14G01119 [Tripterygium wilfordii]|uniref:Uncharacterized protein n=1 Tax=Tripterygium wilfordii TaxID=458696 RepID=A0A7J7CSE5_TRIWF|nr:nucleolar protein 56 [Tripterygium wilfordii]KAF5736964.1 hypothetical protein HS088_TW14G01119 [Tripterygium wilfordii]
MDGLSDEERKALRGSKFAPLPPPPPSRSRSKLAHPGGPLTTNKAAALAKFLERKLQDPNGLSSIDPDILERAVENARDTVFASTSNSGRSIRHVTSFGDSEESFEEESTETSKPKKQKEKKNKKEKKKKKKNKKQKAPEDGECATLKKPKKRMKL